MDSTKRPTNLLIRKILQESNYFIRCDTKDKIYNVQCSWQPADIYAIKYDKEKLYSNYRNLELECPEWAFPSLADIIIHQICTDYKYPYNHLIIDQPIQHEDKDFSYLIKDIFKDGLKPTHLNLLNDKLKIPFNSFLKIVFPTLQYNG